MIREAHIVARLTSLDDGTELVLSRSRGPNPPSEHDRTYSAEWANAGVAQSSPDPLEYMHTNGEERVYKCYFDAYDLPGGVANSLEPDLAKLKRLTQRAPGKHRAHYCLWTQGAQPSFKCVVKSVSVPVHHLNAGAAAMIAHEVTITLAEIT